jgi:hypothetical protein
MTSVVSGGREREERGERREVRGERWGPGPGDRGWVSILKQLMPFQTS